MPTSLQAIAKKARSSPKHCFRNLYHLLNRTNLRTCFHELNKNAASGIDQVDWDDYQANLEENLKALAKRLKNCRYKARPIRRKYIPKGNGKLRPLGIPCIEDKIVQRAVSRILESIYEQDFLDVSYGYRPQRSAQGATHELEMALQFGPFGWIVEADIQGFFDAIDHDWLTRMLELRIGDRKVLRLIKKWLKAGILETDGRMIHPQTGTPQGGIISPILANLYLHHALDLWFEHRVRPQCQGRAKLIRYADDFVCAFQYHSDAEAFRRNLQPRLGKFNLVLAPEKTRKFRFNRFQIGEDRFDFLGFTFRWGTNRAGMAQIWRTTSRKKFRESLHNLKEWIKGSRNVRMGDLLQVLKSKYRGHRNYFGVIGNLHRVAAYVYLGNAIILKWLNRRSQRKSYTWAGFYELLRQNGLAGGANGEMVAA